MIVIGRKRLPQSPVEVPKHYLRALCLGSYTVRTHQCSAKPGTAGALLGLLPPIVPLPGQA